MTSPTGAATSDIAIACSLLPAEKAARGHAFADLFADAHAVTDLPDGYALGFPSDDAWIVRAAELIVAERKCCPFFSFALTFEPDGGPVWLYISGPDEVKACIWEDWVPARLKSGA